MRKIVTMGMRRASTEEDLDSDGQLPLFEKAAAFELGGQSPEGDSTCGS